jgi:hypothetical protein
VLQEPLHRDVFVEIGPVKADALTYEAPVVPFLV